MKLFFRVSLALLVAFPAMRQASTSTVRGAVQDQTGAMIPNATVTLTNTATNAAHRITTNEAGFYVFPGVRR
jgi:hypothetical protein